MSGFPILDLVVGIIFVYFLLSIICSSAIEIILTGMKARATIRSRAKNGRYCWSDGSRDTSGTRNGSASTESGVHGECPSTAARYSRDRPRYALNRITPSPSNRSTDARDTFRHSASVASAAA